MRTLKTSTSTVDLEMKADEVAKKFATDWQEWNTTDTGTFTEYRRPYGLTRKQVDWLFGVWLRQFKWGKDRDRALMVRSIDNLGQSRKRDFLWVCDIHRNGSGTFKVLVKK